jgi:hypothetical protein
MVAGGGIVGILFIFMTGISNFFIEVTSLHFVGLASISTAICYFLVFKGDKYLLYFEIYEKWTAREKGKYVIQSIIFILASLLVFICSLKQ